MIKLMIGNTTTRNIYIVNEEQTIRQLCEQYMPTAIGLLYLNDMILTDEDMDQPLNSFELMEDRNRLISLVKTEGAWKAKIDGNAVKIISSKNLADLRLLEAYNANEMTETRIDPSSEGNWIVDAQIFTNEKTGSMSSYHIAFNPTPTASGKAYVTTVLPDGVEDKEAYIKENYGRVLKLLSTIEEYMDDDVLARIRANDTLDGEFVYVDDED